MTIFIAAFALAQQGHYEIKPGPMPAWVDTLDLNVDERFVNEREDVPVYARDKHPRIRVGDLINAIPEDGPLTPGLFKSPIRPIGRKVIQMDDLIFFEVSRNGFNRSAGWSFENEVDSYTLATEPKPGEGKLFLAWAKKLAGLFGRPTYVVRDELQIRRQENVNYEPANGTIYLGTDQGSALMLAWVWGVRPSKGDVYQRDFDADTGPMYTIQLSYAAPTIVFKSKRDSVRRHVRPRVSLFINPGGIAAG